MSASASTLMGVLGLGLGLGIGLGLGWVRAYLLTYLSKCAVPPCSPATRESFCAAASHWQPTRKSIPSAADGAGGGGAAASSAAGAAGAAGAAWLG